MGCTMAQYTSSLSPEARADVRMAWCFPHLPRVRQPCAGVSFQARRLWEELKSVSTDHEVAPRAYPKAIIIVRCDSGMR
jgi:hypothetical protein